MNSKQPECCGQKNKGLCDLTYMWNLKKKKKNKAPPHRGLYRSYVTMENS